MKPLVIIGDGGHAVVLIDLVKILGREIRGLTSLHRTSGAVFNGIKVLGDDSVLDRLDPDEVDLVNGLGSIDAESNKARRSIYEHGAHSGFQFATLIHPSAIIATDIEFGDGVQIMAGSVLQTGSKVGDNSIINTGTMLDHHSVIGPHCHLAPGVVCSGAVCVGEGSHLGSGATLIQGIQIGAGALVAAGAVVVSTIPDGQRVRGVPAEAF